MEAANWPIVANAVRSRKLNSHLVEHLFATLALVKSGTTTTPLVAASRQPRKC
jgi:hypothetical protein